MPPSLPGVRTDFNEASLRCTYTKGSLVYVHPASLEESLHTRDCLSERSVQRQLATAFDVPRSKVAALVGSLNGSHPPGAESEPPAHTPQHPPAAGRDP